MPVEKIKVLHVVPLHDTKFDGMRAHLFENYNNTTVGLLKEVKNIEDYALIALHFLKAEDAAFLLKNPVKIPVVWFCWGGDLFELGKFYNRFVLPKTKKLRQTLAAKKSIVAGMKASLLFHCSLLVDAKKQSRAIIKAFQHIDYMVPVMPGDFDLLTQHYKVGKMKGFHLNLIIPSVEEQHFPAITGRNILVGNSATFTNNHVEAIDWLKTKDLTGRKVIIPLSYGGSPALAEAIAQYAKKELGEDKVQVLRDFMPFEAYNKLIHSCEIVLMNHLRQQAVGNSIQVLLNGAHLYLQEESTVYQFLKENGIKLSAVKADTKLLGLEEADKQHNRKRTQELFGAERQHQRLDQLLNKIVR